MKNFNIFGVHGKIWFSGEGAGGAVFRKNQYINQYIGGNYLKRVFGQFADLWGRGLARQRGVFFKGERGLISQCTLWSKTLKSVSRVSRNSRAAGQHDYVWEDFYKKKDMFHFSKSAENSKSYDLTKFKNW